VETVIPGQQSLMPSELAGFIAHVSWRPGEGWRLFVQSWAQGQTPPKGHSTVYDRLTADELVDVLCAEQLERCEWLRP